MNRPGIICITDSARPLAESLARDLDGEVIAPASETADVLRGLFRAGRPIVALCASGIVIRILAPLIADKHAEPPVLAVAEDGSAVVPLLGGHRGANALARRIAALTGGTAALTTASEVRFGVALDEPPPGIVLANPDDVKGFTARLLAGEPVRIEGAAEWLAGLTQSDSATLRITATTAAVEGSPDHLVYHPKRLALGVGCERGTGSEELIGLVGATLARHGLSPKAVAGVFSLDLKADEPAVHALAGDLGAPARFFPAARLNEEAHRLANPSEAVLREVGCPGVAEGASLAAAGPQARLVVEKTRSDRATCAVTEASEALIDLPGIPRGTLAVVGIGPGSRDWLAPAAQAALSAATDWVGYGLYLDLVAHLSHGTAQHRFPLGAEEERVDKALALAAQGRRVALVSSGDAGIYAMASLACERLDRGQGGPESRIALEIVPGISAFQAAAARAGALIGHDFCCISLSDLLTPWEIIEKRIGAAAEGDFVTAFYNPRSQRRTDHLSRALAILGPRRSPETPVVIAANLGRAEERVRVVPLSAFDPDDVDMLTIVLVGANESRAFSRGDGSTVAYTPRGYAGRAR